MSGSLTQDRLDWTARFTNLPLNGSTGSAPPGPPTAPPPAVSPSPLLAFNLDPDGVGGAAPGGGLAPDGGPTPAAGPAPGAPPPGDPPPDPAAAAEKAKVDKAKGDISKKFALKSVSDGDAAWKSSETDTVSAALSAVPAADQAVLKNIQVERVHSIDATHAAQYSNSTSVDVGSAATQTTTIKVGDSTFDSGGAPVPADEQKRVIVHEVGHAVANKGQRSADLANAKAQETVNTTANAFNKANDASNTAIDAMNNTVQPVNDAAAAYNAEIAKKPSDPDKVKAAKATYDAAKKDFDAAKGKVDALKPDLAKAKSASDAAIAAQKRTQTAADNTRVPKSAVAKGQAEVDGAAIGADGARTTATGSAGAMSDQDKTASKGYRDAVDDVAKKLKDYTDAVKAGTADSETQDAAVDGAIKTRNDERDKLKQANANNPALTNFAASDKAQDDWATKVKTQSRLPDRPPKIQEFVDLVNKEKITPDTKYAQDNWPFAPEEFFAEAYSLWRVKPDKLKADAKPLFDWFESGKYR